MWTYSQSTGALSRNGKRVATGYSGNGPLSAGYRNNPDAQHVVAKGPIPRGRWRMTEMRLKGGTVGPYAIFLAPVGHDALGRSLFRIHGDNRQNDASHGCIILPRPVREMIWGSGDHDLEVVR